MDPHVAGTQSRSVFVGTATHPLLVPYPTSIKPDGALRPSLVQDCQFIAGSSRGFL
ncbi:hypothetical protein GFS60_07902 (plasmid) [Rhodococcus sp. WAY2]|nr:hypothetical protein GFS60_07902 [Rhodococcus sp. WAY2]